MSSFKILLAISATALIGACAHLSQKTPATLPPAPRQVTVLYVADLHAQLQAHPELFSRDGREVIEEAGGFARVAEAIRRIRAERGGEVLVLDAGDTLQGSGVAAATRGEALIPALNAIGFDAAVPGNWEVVYGVPALRQRQAQLDYPLFATNVFDAATGARAFQPSFVKTVSGVKVAVVGYTDPDVPLRQPPGYSKGFRYEGAEALERELADVRVRENPDVVLVLSHVGLHKAVAMTERMDGIDVHLSADTHERTYVPIERKGKWTVEPGAFGSFLGRLDLWVQDGKIVDRKWELIELTARNHGEDPKVAALVKTAVDAHPDLARQVAHVDQPLMRYEVVETSMDRVIADAIRAEAGTQIGLSNGFRFASPLVPGPVTVADLWTILPINNRVKTGKVTGKQLRAFFEKELENVFSPSPEKRFGGWLPRPSGMSLRFDPAAPAGRRLLELKVDGADVRDDEVYTLAACEREGDLPDTLCRIPQVTDPVVLEVDVHQAVARYLAQDGAVSRALAGGPRVTAVGVKRPLRTQMKELEEGR